MRSSLPAVMLALSCTLSAQAPRFDDLLADDWRLRNTTARTLARASAVDIDALLKVLASEWQGSLPPTHAVGLGGFYDVERPPRETVLVSTRRELGSAWMGRAPSEPGPTKPYQLEVPWHPHALARWLVLRSPAPMPRATTLPRDSVERARVWLHVAQPNRSEIERALADPESANHVATALWLQGESGRDSLRAILAGESTDAHAAIAALGDPGLPTEEGHVAALVQQFVTTRSKATRQRIGTLLLALESRAAAPLAAASRGSRRARQHAVGLLMLLGTHAGSAADALVEHAASDRKTRRRALVALATLELSDEQRVRAATAAMASTKRADPITRALAYEVLGRCGAGVSPTMRTELQQRLLESAPASDRMRLLGCLHDLDALPDMPLADKVAIAEGKHPTTSAWLAVADHGAEATTALLRLLLDPLIEVDVEAVGHRLLERVPGQGRLWLRHQDPEVRELALRIMHRHDPASLATDELLALLDDERPVAERAVAWLGERQRDVAAASRVFALLRAQDAADEVSDAFVEFATRVDLPVAQKLDWLSEPLAAGKLWRIVRGGDPVLLRAEIHRWLGDVPQDDIRTRTALVSELCRAGIDNEHDLAAVISYFTEVPIEEQHGVTNALADSRGFPDSLRPFLDAQLDVPTRPHNALSYAAAREALLKHPPKHRD